MNAKAVVFAVAVLLGGISRVDATVVTLGAAHTNYTFKADTTYYVTGAVHLAGTTVFEGGTVVKYAKNVGATLILDAVKCETAQYRPAIFTAKDDNSVGDFIIGSTGVPTNYYAEIALDMPIVGNTELRHIRISYAVLALNYATTESTIEDVLSNVQIVRCFWGLYMDSVMGTRRFRFRNGLVSQIQYVAFDTCHSGGSVEHATVDNVANLANDDGYGYNGLYFTNCILANVTNMYQQGIEDLYGSHNGFFNAPQFGSTRFVTTNSPFQAVGAGYHYLKAASTFRNCGASTINSGVLNDLKTRTTDAPIVVGGTVPNSTVLGRKARRDSDTPDLGYHYDPIDYAVSELKVRPGLTFTLANGTAVAVYGQNGIVMDGKSPHFVSEGTPSAMNYIVRYSVVQEQPIAWGPNGGSKALVVLDDQNTQPYATAWLRFTHLSVPSSHSDSAVLFMPGTYYSPSLFQVSDCYLAGGSFFIGDTVGGGEIITVLANNIFERAVVNIDQDGGHSVSLFAYNNLFWKCPLQFNYGGDTGFSWDVRDNVFDQCAFSPSAVFPGSYNGYINCGPFDGSLGNDLFPGSFTYASNGLGRFYHASTTFTDVGSRTAPDIGLYHYTTRTNQAKEATSYVDRGAHYVAVNAQTLQPIDSDSDGIADYVEDDNGNGSVDTGETPWNSSQLSIATSAGAGGLILPSAPVGVVSGGSRAVQILHDPGYQMFDVKVNGISKGPRTTWTFSNVTSNQVIEAVFTNASVCVTPSFEPEYWNDYDPANMELGHVQGANNCYNYAVNRRTDTFAQPGRATGTWCPGGSCYTAANMTQYAINDGLVSTTTNSVPSGKTLLALVLSPSDYHWYRRDADGTWSHKNGGTAATNLDNSNALITNPETANRGPYTTFVGYFYTCSSGVQGESSANVQ